MAKNLLNFNLIAFMAIILTSCSTYPNSPEAINGKMSPVGKKTGSLITGNSEPGFSLDDVINNQQPNSGAALPINALLWRAALDTVSVMPLDNVDTFGGTIITEWYAHPEDPTKRIKIAIFILDQELRADSLKVQTYLQQRPEGMFEWQDIGRDDGLSGRLEDLILTRAREIRAASILESN